jgi:hypothetical protein
MSVSDGDMLRVWFSCPFMQSEHGGEMAASLEVCTKGYQQAVVLFCSVSYGIKRSEMH